MEGQSMAALLPENLALDFQQAIVLAWCIASVHGLERRSRPRPCSLGGHRHQNCVKTGATMFHHHENRGSLEGVRFEERVSQHDKKMSVSHFRRFLSRFR